MDWPRRKSATAASQIRRQRSGSTRPRSVTSALESRSSCPPSRALVVGVTMGSGSGSFFARPSAKFEPVDVALARLVLVPERRCGDAGDVAAHDYLHGQRFAAADDADVFIRQGLQVVGDDVACLAEPKCGKLVQYLTLVGYKAEDAVKGRQAVGRDENELLVVTVDLSHLAAAELVQCRQANRVYSQWDAIADFGFTDHGSVSAHTSDHCLKQLQSQSARRSQWVLYGYDVVFRVGHQAENIARWVADAGDVRHGTIRVGRIRRRWRALPSALAYWKAMHPASASASPSCRCGAEAAFAVRDWAEDRFVDVTQHMQRRRCDWAEDAPIGTRSDRWRCRSTSQLALWAVSGMGAPCAEGDRSPGNRPDLTRAWNPLQMPRISLPRPGELE